MFFSTSKVYGWEVTLCFPSLLCIEDTTSCWGDNCDPGPPVGWSTEGSEWDEERLGPPPGGGNIGGGGGGGGGGQAAPLGNPRMPANGPLTSFNIDSFFGIEGVDLANISHPTDFAINPLEAALGNHNQEANRTISGGDPNKTNPRTGDPVDLVTGTLTLREGFFPYTAGSRPFSLQLNYNHKTDSPVSLFGKGWTLSGHEALFGSGVPNIYASGQGSLIQFRSLDDIHYGWGGAVLYKEGIPLFIDVGIDITGEQNTEAIMIDGHGSQSTFSGGLMFEPIGLLPERMEEWIPTGYILLVGERAGAYQVMWKRIEYSGYWLTAMASKGKEVFSINRRMVWRGDFVFPGKEECIYAADFNVHSECLSLAAGAAAQSPDPFPYRAPLPDTMEIVYSVGNQPVMTLLARWHIEIMGVQERGGNRSHVYQFKPYVVEATDFAGRRWEFEYAFQGGRGECVYDWARYEKPESAIFFNTVVPDEEKCPNVERIYRYEAGESPEDVREVDITRHYQGPLYLKSIRYPHPPQGGRGEMTKRFEYDGLGRVLKVFGLDGTQALSVNYDDNNRVSGQQLGDRQSSIRYFIVGNDFDRELQSGQGEAFRGFEVEVWTAGNHRSLVGVDDTGHIRYFREATPNGSTLETTYEYKPRGFAKGMPISIRYPDGRRLVRTFTPQEGMDLPALSPNSNVDEIILKSFRLRREEIQNVGWDVLWSHSFVYLDAPAIGKNFFLVQSSTDPLGRTVQYQYDFEAERSRCQTRLGLPAQVTYPDGSTESFEYNNLEQILFHRNRLGAETRYSYHGTGEGCGQ